MGLRPSSFFCHFDFIIILIISINIYYFFRRVTFFFRLKKQQHLKQNRIKNTFRTRLNTFRTRLNTSFCGDLDCWLLSYHCANVMVYTKTKICDEQPSLLATNLQNKNTTHYITPLPLLSLSHPLNYNKYLLCFFDFDFWWRV